jgi:hypothetical protein
MNIAITHLGNYAPSIMPSAGGYEIDGQVTIDGITYRFSASTFDTESYSGGLDLTLYTIGEDDEVSGEVEWDEDTDPDWDEVEERMIELCEEVDAAIYGEMLHAKDRALAHYRLKMASA